MGLAATQARFLAITSRKAVCEYRSMELAQQKLSLSHEMEIATENYNNSLNATRLVWDADGSGAYRYNLSYDLMTTPSAINQYMPYLLSRQDGKIAVNDTMQNALNGVILDNGGIVYNGQIYHQGDVNYDTAKQAAYQEFMGNLRAQNVIPSSVLNGIMAPDGKYRYIEDAGLGGEPSLRETARTMHITSAISYIDNLVSAVDNGEYSAGSEEAALAEALTFNFSDNRSGYYLHNSNVDNLQVALLKNGNYINGETKLTLADFLNEKINLDFGSDSETRITTDLKVILSNIQSAVNGNLDSIISPNSQPSDWYTEVAGEHSYEKIRQAALDNENRSYSIDDGTGTTITGTVENAELYIAIINYIDTLAKGMYNLLMPDENEEVAGIQPSEMNRNAFVYALTSAIDKLGNLSELKLAIDPVASDISSDGETTVRGFSDLTNYWSRYNGNYAINLSNVTEAFLTDFMNGMDNYEDGCIINDLVSNSVYITDFPEYLYTLNVPNANDDHIWEAEFYSTIFNNICQNGWYENQMLGEKSYLDNALKNGQLFVMSMADDYNYYQNRYAQIHGGHIVEETDEDAVAQAEREYTYLKSKINYKEERIEVETRSIDAELSTLNTEYETVKNLINKNVENAFKLFQS